MWKSEPLKKTHTCWVHQHVVRVLPFTHARVHILADTDIAASVFHNVSQ